MVRHFHWIALDPKTTLTSQTPYLWLISLEANLESAGTSWDVSPVASAGAPVSCFPPWSCPRILDSPLFYPSSTWQRSHLSCLQLHPQSTAGNWSVFVKWKTAPWLSATCTNSISLPAHSREVISNASCKQLLPDLFAIVFETWFQKFVRSLLWIPALPCIDWMTEVNSLTILNLIFLIDEVDRKTIIGIT